MKSSKIIYIIVGLIFVLGLILAIKFGNGFPSNISTKTLVLPERNDTVPLAPFIHDYGTKIVYTLDTTVNKDVYVGDCKTRGGIFNACGSACASDAQVCSQLCALTCEIK